MASKAGSCVDAEDGIRGGSHSATDKAGSCTELINSVLFFCCAGQTSERPSPLSQHSTEPRVHRPTLIGLGELLWDIFPDSRRAGGAPANVAYHAMQLGAHGLPASRVGQDADGEQLVADLAARGLETRLIQTDRQHPTGLVTVSLSAAGQPSYVIHQQVAWEHLEPAPALLAAAAMADAICFGTLAQRTSTSRETIHACLRAAGPQTLIAYDVNLRQHWYEREWIERSIRASDVIKLNDEELVILAKLFELPDQSPARFAAHLHSLGADIVVVTRGASGCSVFAAETTGNFPSEPVTVVDTVGAGDAFTAAFLLALLRGWPLARAAQLANAIGGLVASRAGAMPGIAAEATALARSLDPAW